MVFNKTTLILSIECSNEDFANIILKSLEPENQLIDENSEIQMSLEKENLFIKFSSFSSISTIRNTIDDILSTINTSERIYKVLKKDIDKQ